MQDHRLIAISNLLAQYSIGQFDNPEIELSENLDEIDSIISGVNMLGEELEATTVSRDFFINIYNTVSNILLVTDLNLHITDVNEAATHLLDYSEEELRGMSVEGLLENCRFVQFKDQLLDGQKLIREEVEFRRKDGTGIPTDCRWSRLYSPEGTPNGYLVVAEDLTDRKLKEREILLNIMETQESERIRVADDLHDSLGQELSGIRMMLATIAGQLNAEPKAKGNLEMCIGLLDSSLENIRSICFDLVPSALTQGELIMAMRQIMRKMEMQGDIEFQLNCDLEAVSLPQSHQIAVYRVFQEFVHNSQKHAKCSSIEVDITEEGDAFTMIIRDNGVGFKLKRGEEFSGRGMSTMNSRIKALDGTMELKSAPGKGTSVRINFKLKK